MIHDEFFKELYILQDGIINLMLSKENQYENIEDLLKDTPYESIYRMLELLDGFGINNTKYEVKDVSKGMILNDNCNMHDKCEDYLMHTDI